MQKRASDALLPTALVRGYVPAYRSPEVERAAAQLAQAASKRQLALRRVEAKVTAAESDVWALGVLALNLFEPRWLALMDELAAAGVFLYPEIGAFDAAE